MITPWKRKEIIGDCTLYLGDCMSVMPTLGKVDAVVTDPPFEKEAHTAVRRTQKSIKSDVPDAMDFAAITEEMRDFIPAWCRINCEGWLLAFCQVEAVSMWRDSMEEAKLKYKRGMAWVKPDSSPQFNGQGPAQGYECIATAWCGVGKSSWNGGGKRGVFTHLTNQPDRHGVHKTEKPIPLMRELLTLFSSDGDTILDPFMGSGTTLVACAKLGRSGIGIELDEDYFNIACERVEKAYSQADLFVAPPENKDIKRNQVSMFDDGDAA
jgi:site-specific DNA-methyltransferase (adenine-specific)